MSHKLLFMMQKTAQSIPKNNDHSFSFIYGIILFVIAFVYLLFARFMLDSSEKTAVEFLREEALTTANTQASELKSELQKFSLVPVILRENPDVIDALIKMSPGSLERVNEKLHSLTMQTDASYIYVIDTTGRTIASSNYQDELTFVGKDYRYRPYFIEAMQEGMSQYYAKGQTTGRPGLFLGAQIKHQGTAIGVIVVKVEFNDISMRWQDPVSTSFVVNQDGIILFSGNEALNFKTITDLTDGKKAEILQARQFGTTPLSKAKLQLNDTPFALNEQGQKTVASKVDISELKWQLFRLSPINTAMESSKYRAQLIILIVGIILFSIVLAYRRRTLKEQEKTAATKLLKSEVARQTKELSETNEKLEHEIKQRELFNVRFQSAREELAQANRLGSVGAITASVAHELNQPVAAIRTYAENGLKLLQRGNSEQTTSNLDAIVSLTERIGSISTQLRRYARRGSHGIGRVDIEDVISGVDLLMGDRLRKNRIDLKIVGDYKALPPVRAGRIRLEQVIVNLLQNSIDALKNNDNPIITMSFEQTSSHIEVLVADNGTGIDAKLASQIFTPFITSKSSGMGMGLGIAKDIINEFGGGIDLVENGPKGATFLIRLKRYD